MDANALNPQTVLTKLRDYQREALELMVSYISKYSSSKVKGTGLVALPTGSGKTPIIGVLARCFKNIGGVLIVSPRVAVSEQLFKEVSNNLFSNKFKMTVPIPKEVEYFDDNFDKWKDSIGNTVIITTIQKIDYLRRKNKSQYNYLLKHIELVLFDEGHYEPAASWSETIRNFNCPRIIFSATPFRNDLKAFDIDWNYHYFKSYYDLAQKNVIRSVDFIEKQGIVEPKEKIKDIVNTLHRLRKDNYSAKAIINCENSASILEISRILLDSQIPFIAIHENFTKEFRDSKKNKVVDYLRKSVPKLPEEVDADIWIHQYKLLEGIDYHYFQMVAIYEPLRNFRSLIQQIGRVLRNPERNETPALVIDYTNRQYKNEWDKYLSVDKSGEIIKGFSESIFYSINKVLPDSVYFDGKLRDKLNLQEFEKWDIEEVLKEVRLPLKVNLLQTLSNFDFKSFIETDIEKRFKDNDYVCYHNPAGKDSILYFYFIIRNSTYITNKYFPILSHEVCFIKKYNGFIAFYDSSDYLPYGKDKIGIGTALRPDTLKRFFKTDTESILTRISLKNSNLGSREIRSHSFIAPSVEETTPFLNDFSHYLDSAFGYYTDKKVFKSYKSESNKEVNHRLRTYIGFSTGRISQNEPENLSFKEYIDWLNYIIGVISKKCTPIETFKRYAIENTNSTNVTPKNILLDLLEFEGLFDFSKDNGEEITLSEMIPDICLDIRKISSTDGFRKLTFKLRIENQAYSILIRYDNQKKKYILECPDLEMDISGRTSELNSKTKSLITLLNERQAFRIITANNLVYSKGNFYKPFLKRGKNFGSTDFQLQHILTEIDKLSEIGSEKGKKDIENEFWEPNTIFNLIDSRGKGSSLSKDFKEDSLIICDDMGTEIADFIILEKTKLIFVHAKGVGNNPKTPAKTCSASAISEVCNQAIKNVHYISMFDDSIPTKLDRWGKDYICKNKRTGVHIVIKNRIRGDAAKLKPEEIWKDILKLKFDPNTEREVWLILGKLFSKSVFLSKLNKDKPAAVAMQAALTLQSTLASIGSMGAKLRVFCS